MKLLLDTHFVLAFMRQEFEVRYPRYYSLFSQGREDAFVSVVSLWEISIKTRLGKLEPGMPLEKIPRFLQEAKLAVVCIDIPHVITAAEPEPLTRDPFDRLLLAQCQVEGLQLVTIDRLLVDHPMAFRI